MINFNSPPPPQPVLEMLQNKTEGIRCGRPMTGRVRDGDGETGLFGSAAFMRLDAGGRGERRRAGAAPAPASKSFLRVTALSARRLTEARNASVEFNVQTVFSGYLADLCLFLCLFMGRLQSKHLLVSVFPANSR